MIIECPKCKARTAFPSRQQIEAYRNVHINGLTYDETALVMNSSKQAVCALLQRLNEKRPDLFEAEDLPTIVNTKTTDFDAVDETKIVRKW